MTMKESDFLQLDQMKSLRTQESITETRYDDCQEISNREII